MEKRSAIAQQFISDEIGRALSLAGLPQNHEVRVLLDQEAEILGTRSFAVHCNGESLDKRIEQLKQDPQFAHTFQKPSAKVARRDMQELRRNFDQIVRGEVVVE